MYVSALVCTSCSAGTISLYDFGARMYDPVTARWLTQDPLAEKYYSMSPYLYCAGNPIRYVDPTGKFPIETIWDIGNVIYDIGAAIGNHIRGNHSAAKSNWSDLGMDFAAVMIPYVPAGISKIAKGTETAVGMVNDTKKATTITENAAKGKAFEAQVEESLGTNKAKQVTIEAADGARTRVDFVQKTDGKVTLTEAKGSQTAPLTKGQKSAHPQIGTSGGTVRGNKGAEIGLPAGTKIPPTKVNVVRPEDLLKKK